MTIQLQASDIRRWNEMIWVNLGILTWGPGLVISAYKMRECYRGRELLRNKTQRIVDWIIRLLFGYCFVYYFIDALLIILMSKITMVCYQAFFLHHITAIFGMRHLLTTKKIILWFEALSIAMHSVVLTFPTLMILQYLYFASMLLNIALVYIAPYKNLDNCKRVRKYHLPIVVSLVMAWYFSCLHLMDSLND